VGGKLIKSKPRKRDTRITRARSLRREMTEAEQVLWWHLRNLPKTNSHFRRQATIGPFFADFACHQRRLVIELDGGQHAEERHASADAKRTSYLEAKGYRVLRFWNNEVLEQTEGVISLILAALGTPPTPDPSPPLRGGRGERCASASDAGSEPAIRKKVKRKLTSLPPLRGGDGGSEAIAEEGEAHA
jgi:very-short-patch-repair endonuclease